MNEVRNLTIPEENCVQLRSIVKVLMSFANKKEGSADAAKIIDGTTSICQSRITA
jgi:hypothetical protein